MILVWKMALDLLCKWILSQVLVLVILLALMESHIFGYVKRIYDACIDNLSKQYQSY